MSDLQSDMEKRPDRHEDEPTKPDPQGIIAILTSPDGDVIATAADFNRSGMGGCKLWEAQMWRARDQVKWRAVKAYASPAMTDALSSYVVGQIAGELCSKKGGHKITIRAVGWPEDVQAQVSLR